MSGNTTPVVFITANVGSIFEEPSSMLGIWAAEFLLTISRLDPKFVALHCQEVGGKNYEESMQYVKNFVKLLMESDELRLFDKVRIYLDEDFAAADKFTALGNFYFVHESVTDALIYDFNTRSFVEVNGKQVYTEDIENVSTKEKRKFPLEFFPECKWSRKGFLRTRWNISGTVFDLINIHLFHDASNFVAIESFPSRYSEIRRHALMDTFERFHHDEHGYAPFFMFGDFNFRTDTQGVVKRLSEGLNKVPAVGDTEDSTVEYCDNNTKVFSLGKKTFDHLNHQDVFSGADSKWLREFDVELDSFKDQVFEFLIGFQPSYPFEEVETSGKLYMKTRCPAWCDRVLLSKDALPLVKDFSNPAAVEYGLMGKETCMGDHKPVFLKIELRAHAAKDQESQVNDGVIDTGQLEFIEKSGFVKRVNSASLVESKCRREDWKSNRCNSDVSWNPTQSQEVTRMGELKNPLLRGSSKIRLISTPTGLNLSLPRLTSHHSSSDEDWFEVVEGDDDVLEMDIEPTKEEDSPKIESKEAKLSKTKNPFSILIRLSKDRGSGESHKAKIPERVAEEESVTGVASHQIPEPKQTSNSRRFLDNFIKSVGGNRSSKVGDEDTVSWETIDLEDSKPKDVEKKRSIARREGCCSLQ